MENRKATATKALFKESILRSQKAVKCNPGSLNIKPEASQSKNWPKISRELISDLRP